MNVAAAIVLAYLLGSIPTAIWVTRAMGYDIRAAGSGNPGTANAVGVAGPAAGATVLLLDAAKGAAAVVIGRWLGGDAVGLVAAIAAVFGQIVNVWLGFRGGKGLGVGLGSTLAHWPLGVVVLLPFLGIAAKLSGSAARGALITFAATIGLAAVAVAADLPNAWGIDLTWSLLAWAVAVVALVTPKFVRDVVQDRVAARTDNPVA